MAVSCWLVCLEVLALGLRWIMGNRVFEIG